MTILVLIFITYSLVITFNYLFHDLSDMDVFLKNVLTFSARSFVVEAILLRVFLVLSPNERFCI